MAPLTFVPFQAHVTAEFWELLSRKKIDEAKLADDDTPVLATYTCSTNSDGHVPFARIDLTRDAFDTSKSCNGVTRVARGFVRNTNTIEDFKSCDKDLFLRRAAENAWDDIQSGAALEEPSLLNSFALLCFADLKKYTYVYWTAYPAFHLSWEYESTTILSVEEQEKLDFALHKWQGKTSSSQWSSFAYDSEAHSVHTMSEWESIPAGNRVFAFCDPCNSVQGHVGWPARNLLSLLAFKLGLGSVDIISFRASKAAVRYKGCKHARIDTKSSIMPKVTGWERNAAGKLGPRVANLAALLNPSKLADDAVDLNLKLMKWRIAPDLDLQVVKDCKCLLLGAGTLGCYVARLLLGWGVKNITLVDSGRVSFSNPVRQPLFKFTDCLDGGKPKAETAAEALREIYPGVNASGHQLSVPMIGHPFTSAKQSESDFRKLEDLIDSHDAIFLLMDSRESRWLPTVMGAAKRKIVINAALGFDSFVVLRHGVPPTPSSPSPTTSHISPASPEHSKAPGKVDPEQLGCYFCNDVVAPSDSTTDRSLDQQCTVTRPGLSSLSSSIAVELLISILQHPLRAQCEASSDCRLGTVPHTIRGSLRTWENKVLHGKRFEFCSGCSVAVVKGFSEGGWEFVRRACEEKGWIEEMCGLKDVQSGIEGVDVEWDSSDSNSEDHDLT